VNMPKIIIITKQEALAIVDCNKKFTKIFVGFPSSVNDSWVLCKSSLHRKTQYNGLFDIERGSQHEFPPYILGDKIYPLIYWIMTLFKTKKIIWSLNYCSTNIFKGCPVVENAFGILKKPFMRC
jgi:hypothetical protein